MPTPLAAVAHGWLLAVLRHDAGADDPAALLTVYERLAGWSLAAAQPRAAPGRRAPAAREGIERVGFVGLGRLGRPIAECIRRAGFPMIVHNRSQGAVGDMVREGAERAASPAQTAARADVVLTCLPDNEAVERVYLGPSGLIEGARPEQVLVDVGTTALGLTRRLDAAAAARAAIFVDAPVTGGIPAALEGRLTVMIGASEEGFRRASPVLAAMAERLFHVGPPGAGQSTKLVGNMLLGTNTAALAEGLALGVAAGLAADELLERLLRSSADSWVMRLRGPKMVQRDFRPLFTVLGRLKDSQAALALGRELHVPLPLAAVAHELYQAAAAGGCGAEDFATVVRVYEGLAGLTVGAATDRGAEHR
ncbi:MAG: NAD(P)-dependent oxidoreductase [Chloroflexi bacterium]|nr:NAD(P)-dependent oxidoreductase [Chloroflexota bacterium]